ncbi:MAG TPA: hypothetical protein VJ964_03010 [Balneolaceae bacterium]|nr:hypothetical protein [Balneolaceae bacterium]
MKLTLDIIKKMLGVILATREDEIDCDECYDRIESFVEIKLSGKSAEEAMPLVKDHLKRCQECRQEYEALLEALQTIKKG